MEIKDSAKNQDTLDPYCVHIYNKSSILACSFLLFDFFYKNLHACQASERLVRSPSSCGI